MCVLNVNLPFSMYSFKICGVYKIEFDGGEFYIGGSVDLRSRASAWSSCFLSEDATSVESKFIQPVVKKSKTAIFDIIELCHPKDVRDKEAFYLQKYEKDLNLLSVSEFRWKSVLQYSKAGFFIKRHVSISAAANYNNCGISKIQRVLTGERAAYKDMVFIYESDYDNRRKEIIQSRGYKREPKNKRKVLLLAENGEVLQVFKTIVSAARFVNVRPESVSRALNGIQKKAGGYCFKYE